MQAHRDGRLLLIEHKRYWRTRHARARTASELVDGLHGQLREDDVTNDEKRPLLFVMGDRCRKNSRAPFAARGSRASVFASTVDALNMRSRMRHGRPVYFLMVSEAYTSKTCSNCGSYLHPQPLTSASFGGEYSWRQHTALYCTTCKMWCQRDRNSA